MMTKELKFHYMSCLVLGVILCVGCIQNKVVADKFDFSFPSIYQSLGLTKIGLDYPTQEALENCKQYRANCEKDYSQNYISVQKAKKELLANIAIDPQHSLAFTLDTMCLQCGKNTEALRKENEVAALETSLECLGAITALFYFNDMDQDKIIMNRLLEPSPQVLTWLSKFRFEWIYNRPDPDKWIASLDKLPSGELDPDMKNAIIQAFEEAKVGFEQFGVMLGVEEKKRSLNY